MPPKFILVRHGEAEHNVLFHQVGVSAFSDPKVKDAPLTEKGVKQAQETGKALSQMKLLDIWCSPLTRTIQTAEEIFEEAGINSIYLHDNLLETQGGNHVCNERKAKYELKKKYNMWDMSFMAEMAAYWIERESVYSARSRIKMLLMWLTELYKEKSEEYHVVLVTHKDLIYSLTGKELSNGEYIIVDHTIMSLME